MNQTGTENLPIERWDGFDTSDPRVKNVIGRARMAEHLAYRAAGRGTLWLLGALGSWIGIGVALGSDVAPRLFTNWDDLPTVLFCGFALGATAISTTVSAADNFSAAALHRSEVTGYRTALAQLYLTEGQVKN